MKQVTRLPRVARTFWWCVVAALLAPGAGFTQTAPGEGEFVYVARDRDTLIGVSRRLLIDPARWSELQSRNQIRDPRRIPLGTQIRIPYSWLRLNSEVATVTALSGEVRNGERPVNRGDALPEGSQIHTGPDGSVTLSLGDGSAITLQKSSTLSLDGMSQITGAPEAHDTRVELKSGRLQTVVKPQGNAGRFEIRTPVAVSAVRGTQFRSTFEPGTARATTETLEGLVAVSASTAAVSLPAGFGTRVENGAAPSPPTPLLPPPDLQGIPDTNIADRLALRWPAIAGAVAYRVQLAPDAEFQTFIVDVDSPAPAIDVPAPADGNYWLRVRSIDNLGLEGPDAVRALAQQLPPPPPPLPAPPIPDAPTLDAGTLQIKWRTDTGVRYRVQISRDREFRTLLVDQTLDQAQLSLPSPRAGIYFARIQVIGAGDASTAFGEARQFEVPLPRWLRILIPLAMVAAFVA